MDEDHLAAVVRRLSRPHSSGGTVIERSVILAEGADSAAILGWIEAHHGVADFGQIGKKGSGLHAEREHARSQQRSSLARRFVLPADAFDGA